MFPHSLSNIFAVSNCKQFIAVFPALTAVAHLQSHATGRHLVMGWTVAVLKHRSSPLQWDKLAATGDSFGHLVGSELTGIAAVL